MTHSPSLPTTGPPHPPDVDDDILGHLQLQYPELAQSQEIPSEETVSYASQLLNVVLHDDGPTLHSLLTETTTTPSPYPVAEGILIKHTRGMGATAKNSDEGKRKYIDSHREDLKYNHEIQVFYSGKRVKIDYLDTSGSHNKGTDYFALSLRQLQSDFPRIPETYLRSKFKSFRSFYAPTYLYILEQEKRCEEWLRNNQKFVLPYVPNLTPFQLGYNGKERALYDADFDQERLWLMEEITRREHVSSLVGISGPSFDPGLQVRDIGRRVLTGQESAYDVSVELNGRLCDAGSNAVKITETNFVEKEKAATSEGGNVEVQCGCCADTFLPAEMVPCLQEHLFCAECLNKHAANALSSGNPYLKCMDTHGCQASFSASVLRGCLSEKMIERLEWLEQRHQIEMAGLKLKECPFCHWGCIVGDECVELFHCGNTDVCGVISCGMCERENHLPKTCEEFEGGKKLEVRHVIEEAMTNALKRNCPGCNKPFIKEEGCNKISCRSCRTLSCYICRNIITGYEHFDPTPPGQLRTEQYAGMCWLWDETDERHANEVAEAGARALEEYTRNNPDSDVSDIEAEFSIRPHNNSPQPPDAPAQCWPPQHGPPRRPPTPPAPSPMIVNQPAPTPNFFVGVRVSAAHQLIRNITNVPISQRQQEERIAEILRRGGTDQVAISADEIVNAQQWLYQIMAELEDIMRLIQGNGGGMTA